jgi:hypothetical protein
MFVAANRQRGHQQRIDLAWRMDSSRSYAWEG